VKKCPVCGRENPEDRDFCECGEYLRWEQTTYRPVVKPPAPAPQSAGRPADATPGGAAPRMVPPSAPSPPSSAPPVPPPAANLQAETASLTLGGPDEDNASDGPPTVTAAPGGRATILGLIRNQSAIVDNYDLTIHGLPADWWTISPRVAYLVPQGREGTYEQQIQAHVHPPHSTEAQARAWPFEVVATSRAYGTTVATAAATLIVTPYVDISSEVKPERVTGRWRARYTLTVRNRANASMSIDIRAEDTDGTCRFRFPRPVPPVPPGGRIAVPFTVRPPRQIWVGRPIERQLSVTTTPVGVDQPQAPSKVVFRQRRWIPKWVVILLAVLIVLAAVAAFGYFVGYPLIKHLIHVLGGNSSSSTGGSGGGGSGGGGGAGGGSGGGGGGGGGSGG